MLVTFIVTLAARNSVTLAAANAGMSPTPPTWASPSRVTKLVKFATPDFDGQG
jgi:hypothetical protein